MARLAETGLELRGEQADLFEQVSMWIDGEEEPPDEPVEWMMHGPANTGKTVTWLYVIHMLCETYAGIQVLLCRQYLKDTRASICKTFEQHVVPDNHPCLFNANGSRPSRRSREMYAYPNGSEIHLGGIVDNERFFSTEWSIVGINEVNQVTKDSWERFHRALRWDSEMPFYLLIGDCNPDSVYNWVYPRFVDPKRKRDPMRNTSACFHVDNPALYDGDGNITRFGKGRLAGLHRGTSGTTKKRLALGIWCAAEGAVWDVWDEKVHVLKGRTLHRKKNGLWYIVGGKKDIELTWTMAAMDWGWHVGTFQVWGFDKDHRAYLIAEWYLSHRNDEYWVHQVMLPAYRKFGLYRIVADSADPGAINLANGHLIDHDGYGIVQGAQKEANSVRSGIMLVHGLLDPSRPGGPRMFVLDNALQHEPDHELEGKCPTCWVQEVPAYRWRPPTESRMYERAGGPPLPEEPLKKDDHGCDTARYMARFAFGLDAGPEETDRRDRGTWRELLELDRILEEDMVDLEAGIEA